MIYSSEASGFCDAISSCAAGSPTSALSPREPSLSQCVHLFTARSLEPIPQDLEGRDISCRLHRPPHTRRWAKGLASVGELSHPPSVHADALPKVRPARGNTALFCEIYSGHEQHHPARVQKKHCISGDPTVPLLANLFDHVWLAACMSAG